MAHDCCTCINDNQTSLAAVPYKHWFLVVVLQDVLTWCDHTEDERPLKLLHHGGVAKEWKSKVSSIISGTVSSTNISRTDVSGVDMSSFDVSGTSISGTDISGTMVCLQFSVDISSLE